MLLLVPFAYAQAEFPEDISIVAMDDYGGVSTVALSSNDYVVTGYQTVVKELGTTIANKPMAPGETLGVYGFHVGIQNTFAFIRTGSTDGTNPAGWDLMAPDEKPASYLFLPQITVRKGLPMSFELGANVGWIGMTRTGTFGFFGRWAPLEGYRQIPDLCFQIGYAGYVGNDELEIGVLDMSATLGYSLPFGTTEGIHQAVFSPYVGIGLNRIHAAPRANLATTQLEERVTEVTGYKSQENGPEQDGADVVFDKGFVPLTLAGGFRIVNGDFAATFSGGYSPGLIATANIGFGFVY